MHPGRTPSRTRQGSTVTLGTTKAPTTPLMATTSASPVSTPRFIRQAYAPCGKHGEERATRRLLVVEGWRLDVNLPVALHFQPKAVRLAGHGAGAPKSGAAPWAHYG